MKKNRTVPIIAVILAAAALFLKFALVGYSFSAYLLAGAAVVLLVLHFLVWGAKRGSTAARVLTAVLAVLIAAGLALFAVSESFVVKNARTEERAAQAEYIIVLGAGVNGTVPSLSLRNRLDAALAFLEENPAAVAVVTGGQGSGEDLTEAECMRLWLEGRGIAPERILTEPRAENTRENLKFSFDLIRGREGGSIPEPVAVVSSEYHLLRAKMQAEKLGVDCAGVAARTTLPVLRINYFIREAFGAVYEFVS